jgi:hypothetical protein
VEANTIIGEVEEDDFVVIVYGRRTKSNDEEKNTMRDTKTQEMPKKVRNR